MDHIAIMKKEWGFIDKILSRQKIIESRWYVKKYKPWDAIKKGEIIYLKNSGGLVTAKAEVGKVKQFSDLNPEKIKSILDNYGSDIGINKKDTAEFFKKFRDKKY